MKLSVFTTITDPIKRGEDNFRQIIESYSNFADEVIIVNGSKITLKDIPAYQLNIDGEMIMHEWPKEFKWPLIGQQFQRGYEACTGDWVIHADLDFIFHENDYEDIRKACEFHDDAPALSAWKWQFTLPDRYNLKSRLVIMVNKGKYGDRIKFNSGGDLCQPSLDGDYLTPDDVPEARIGFFNYEKPIKTKKQIMVDVGRMDRAYYRHFNKYLYSKDGSDLSAFEGWMEMALGRIKKPSQHIKLSEHPRVMRDTIKGLKHDQFGYSAFGLETNDYVKGLER